MAVKPSKKKESAPASVAAAEYFDLHLGNVATKSLQAILMSLQQHIKGTTEVENATCAITLVPVDDLHVELFLRLTGVSAAYADTVRSRAVSWLHTNLPVERWADDDALNKFLRHVNTAGIGCLNSQDLRDAWTAWRRQKLEDVFRRGRTAIVQEASFHLKRYWEGDENDVELASIDPEIWEADGGWWVAAKLFIANSESLAAATGVPEFAKEG